MGQFLLVIMYLKIKHLLQTESCTCCGIPRSIQRYWIWWYWKTHSAEQSGWSRQPVAMETRMQTWMNSMSLKAKPRLCHSGKHCLSVRTASWRWWRKHCTVSDRVVEGIGESRVNRVKILFWKPTFPLWDGARTQTRNLKGERDIEAST